MGTGALSMNGIRIGKTRNAEETWGRRIRLCGVVGEKGATLYTKEGMMGTGEQCRPNTGLGSSGTPAHRGQGGVGDPDDEARVSGKGEALDTRAKRPKYATAQSQPRAHPGPTAWQGPLTGARTVTRFRFRVTLLLLGSRERPPTDSPSVLSPLPTPFPD